MSTYSIRQSLQGALQDFVRSSGFDCTHLEEFTRELVGYLAAYREEAHLLFPDVYIFAKDEGLRALNPGGNHLTIASIQLTAEAASRVLKDCAPLAIGGWAIFVVREDQSIRYGVFRSARHSLSTQAEEGMRGLENEIPVMLIRNRGHLVVELQNASGNRFTASLKTTVAQASALGEHVRAFVEIASAGVVSNENFKNYLSRLLTEFLQRSHGTLLGVVGTSITQDVRIADAVWPNPPIPLASLHADALATKSADSLSDLQAAEVLLSGMMNCDGIVLFGPDGSVLAYRVFIRPEANERADIPDVGGGRRRAFQLMKLRQDLFKAAFFKSQDGDTLCEVSTQ